MNVIRGQDLGFWDAEDSCTEKIEAAGVSKTLTHVYQSTHAM